MFITVLQQVVILLILVLFGVLLTKIKFLTAEVVRGMTDTVLTFVTPCVIIKSFIREFDKNTLKAIIISFLIALLIHIGFILLSRLLFIKSEDNSRRVLRFAIIFTNCGFMSLPLQEALLGETGVLYCASFIAIFNLLIWSFGIIDMSGDKKYLSPKKLIVNPGIIGLCVGFLVFVLSIPVPSFIELSIGHIAALNTPIPMIIIGYHIANSNIISGLKDLKCIFAIAIRLFVFPLVAIGGMYICGVRGDMLVSMAISASAPTAAITTMFSAKLNKDTALSVNLVSLSTLLSLISMPIIITLAQIIA